MKTLILFSLLLVSCAEKPTPPKEVCTRTASIDDDSRDDVLIIGDSISYGYTPTVVENLQELDVFHADCSAKTTEWGVEYADLWLSSRERYKLITFNHGMWDIVPFYNVSLEEYKENLRVIGEKVKAKADHVIFFTTTYVPSGIQNRSDVTANEYNEAALEVMQELGVTVYDLNGYSRTISNTLLANDIHYTEQGSQLLGEYVTDAIRGELGL